MAVAVAPAHPRDRGPVATATGLHLGVAAPDAEGSARRVIGPTFGIISECRELAPLSELPHVHACVAVGPRRMPGWWLCMPVEGTGVSTQAHIARLAAVSEAVERYCAMAPEAVPLIVRAAYREVRSVAVSPGSLALLSQGQYRRFPKLEPLTPEKAIDWRRAYSLTRRREVLVPAALVHFSRVGRPPNNFVADLGSTGLACHPSLPRAILAGLCEVLERDALAIAWHNQLPLVALDADGTAAEELLAGARRDAPDFSLFQVPTDSPFPVVLALARHDTRYPHAVVGAASRPDAIEAATKALFETFQILRRLRSRPAPTPKRIRLFDHHAELYATAEGAALLKRNLPVASSARPLASLPSAGTDDVTRDLAIAVAALADTGLEVLVAELTTADAAEAGFRVVRVVIPGAVDMSMDARFPRLGSPRLFELPVALGLRGRPLAPSRLNLMPVPLA